MLHKESLKEVIDRLAKIEGHIRSVREMVSSGRDCPDVLIQIAAVRSALNQVGKLIMEEHIETCIVKAFEEGEEEKAIADLKEALRKLI